MKTFSALLALCEGNSPVIGEFPSQKPVTWNFDFLSALEQNKNNEKGLISHAIISERVKLVQAADTEY